MLFQQALAPGSVAPATRRLLCRALGSHSAVRLSIGARLVRDLEFTYAM